MDDRITYDLDDHLADYNVKYDCCVCAGELLFVEHAELWTWMVW